MCFIADKGNTAGYIRTITKIDSDYHDPFMNRSAEKCYKFFRCGEHTHDKSERHTLRRNNKETGRKPVVLP